MSSIRPWILAARPKTLFATLAPIIVGISLSYKISNTIDWCLTSLIILSAVLLQIGSNYANDAYDYLKGADTKNRKGPKRMVQSGILSANSVLNAMYAIFILSVLIGYFLARIGGWPIIVIGLLSIVFAIIYTAGPYPLAYNGLGEITVFIFFGIIATIGTLYLQIVNIDSYFNLFTLEVFVAASSVGLLNTAILVVNKSDLINGELDPEVNKLDHVLISLKENLNLDKLISKIKNKLKTRFIINEDILITRERHRQHLVQCSDNLTNFLEKNDKKDFDKAAEDLRLATRHLGMIVGKVDVEEILGSIFNDFCIGK